MILEGRRVAIVHERFTERGGSEAVVAQLHAIWPEARIHAPILDRSALPDGLAGADIRTGKLQYLYRGGPRYAYLLPLLPSAVKRLEVGRPAVIIASHHAFANQVRVPPGTQLISYTHTPARWMWDADKRSGEAGGRLGRVGLGLFAATQRRADVAAARRAHLMIVNSGAVAERARAWWGVDSLVIPPPVNVDYFTPDNETGREDFYLLAGRLVPYKRPEVAAAAARRAGVRLVVVGEGRSRSAVESAAGPGTEFLGSVDDPTLRHLFRTCRALLFPGEEDFGIVPVEAQACGTPVIGLGAGGLLDTVIDGVTGILYSSDGDDTTALANAISAFDASRFQTSAIRRHAEQFSEGTFRRRMGAAVGHLVTAGRGDGAP